MLFLWEKINLLNVCPKSNTYFVLLLTFNRLSEVIATLNKQSIPENKNHLTLEVCATRIEDDVDVEVPYVKYTFRKAK